MRFQAVCGMVIVALLTFGCNRDGQVNADLDVLDEFTKELMNKVASGKTSAEGVTAAQEYLDTQKDEIRTRMTRMVAVRGFQVNEATKTRLTKSITDNVMKVMGLKIQMLTQTMKDKTLDNQLQKLIEDYTKLIKPD